MVILYQVTYGRQPHRTHECDKNSVAVGGMYMCLDTYVATVTPTCVLVQEDVSLYPHFRQIGMYKGLSIMIRKLSK